MNVEKFVKEWQEALQGLELILANRSPTKIVQFCGFVAAVRAHPEHRMWPNNGEEFDLASANLVTDVVFKFLNHEKRRKMRRKEHFSAKKEQRENGGLLFCPHHRRWVKYRPEECRLIPQNQEWTHELPPSATLKAYVVEQGESEESEESIE